MKHDHLLFRECRQRVFENRILRRIFGPRRDDNREWRRLKNKKLFNLYRLLNIFRMTKPRRFFHSGYITCPPLSYRFNQLDYITWTVQTMKFVIVFSTPHSHPSWTQIFASGSSFQIPLACIPPLMWESMLHIMM